MSIFAIFIGYLSIGFGLETLVILKDLILRRIWGYDYFHVDLMSLKYQVPIRLLSAIFWPIEIFMSIQLIVRFARGKETKYFDRGQEALKEIYENDKD